MPDSGLPTMTSSKAARPAPTGPSRRTRPATTSAEVTTDRQIGDATSQYEPVVTPSQDRIPAKLTAITIAPPTTAPSAAQRLRRPNPTVTPSASPATIIGKLPDANPTPCGSVAGSATTSCTGAPTGA